MLSYVAPVQEKMASSGPPIGEDFPSPPRSLSLRLNSYNAGDIVVASGCIQHQSQKNTPNSRVQALFNKVVESFDERTHLLNDDGHSTPRPQMKLEKSRATNLLTIDNNDIKNSSSSVSDDSDDDNVNLSIDEAVANEITTNTLDFQLSNKQWLHQNFPLNHQHTVAAIAAKKQKLSKLGSNKTVGLKRVSFGSSKGSMVETLVFETPTPLSEHMVSNFGFGSETDYKTNLDDSGIDIQEESERSILRVSIYHSSLPQHIYPPECFTEFENNFHNSLSNYNCNIEDNMMTASPIPGYDRQQSTDSGWDNPFRPDGDLSREADEIVKMISGGKQMTPTEGQGHVIANGKSTNGTAGNGKVVAEDITKSGVSQNQTAQNVTNGSHRTSMPAAVTGSGADNKASAASAQISKQVVPGPTSASHVVIDEKKNKKKGCCVVQ